MMRAPYSSSYMVVIVKDRTKRNEERIMTVIKDREKIKGDAAVTASPRIQQSMNMIYGWASSPSHIGQSPNPAPKPGPA
jgi:hypothetical protein